MSRELDDLSRQGAWVRRLDEARRDDRLERTAAREDQRNPERKGLEDDERDVDLAVQVVDRDRAAPPSPEQAVEIVDLADVNDPALEPFACRGDCRVARCGGALR